MRDPESDYENDFENLSEPFLGSDGEAEDFGEGEGAFGEASYEEEAMFESLGEGAFGELDREQFGDFEDESSYESGLGEGAFEAMYEGEQFSFSNAFKGIAAFAKKAAPILKKVAKVAAPLVGAAIGGPIGAKVGSFASNLLGEGEEEGEFDYETEAENEAEMEAVMEGPLNEQQILGELMAAAASRAATDLEAEAQIGSATAIVLSRADLAALQDVLPDINRGIAVLTRVLRRRGDTREAIRAIPTIVKRSAVTLRKRAASGRPVTRSSAARAMATQTRRVLGTPSVCAKALKRNARATQSASRRPDRSRGEQRRRYAF
ncbi:MAG TPA: hypothetical protein VN605_08035 [Thermoanaerobaculia bacterium]|nr:hypothetical protein [Thermoanaerobaculia bacterium]